MSLTADHQSRALPDCVVRFAVLFLGLGMPGASWAAEPPAPDLEAGRAAYVQQCARCHGASGKGDGVDAKRFYPRPRDLTMGVYKFRSTASGTPPTDEDLFRTITNGLPGTNMPDWKHLSEDARWQLVHYLKSLAPAFEQTEPSPVSVPPELGRRQVDLAKGRLVYEKLGCAACHGAAGRANGMSSAGLVDDWGLPIRPADLTQGWSYRGGADPRSIVLRFLTGIDGAGMPSYAEAVPAEDIWQLAHYVAFLQEPPHWNMIAHPMRVASGVPDRPDDPRWAQAERTDVRLRNVVSAEGEWQHPPTVRSLTLEAIADADTVALRLSWNDPTEDLPAEASAQAGTAAPADRFALVLKPEGSRGDVATLQAWPYAGAPPLDLCVWSSDTGKVWEWIGTGFEPSTSASGLSATADYQDGRRRVVLRRPLHPATPDGAAAIVPDGFTALAFAVWDGGNPSARMVSPWIEIALVD
jgi:cytochrome c oxidase cbb3-type subunit 2